MKPGLLEEIAYSRSKTTNAQDEPRAPCTSESMRAIQHCYSHIVKTLEPTWRGYHQPNKGQVKYWKKGNNKGIQKLSKVNLETWLTDL